MMPPNLDFYGEIPDTGENTNNCSHSALAARIQHIRTERDKENDHCYESLRFQYLARFLDRNQRLPNSIYLYCRIYLFYTIYFFTAATSSMVAMGAPQPGQLEALSDTCLPHSLQSISAISELPILILILL